MTIRRALGALLGLFLAGASLPALAQNPPLGPFVPGQGNLIWGRDPNGVMWPIPLSAGGGAVLTSGGGGGGSGGCGPAVVGSTFPNTLGCPIVLQNGLGNVDYWLVGSDHAAYMNLFSVGGTAFTLGSHLSSASLPVVPASDATFPVSLSGVSTAANQATEIGSLATIATNTGSAIPAGTNLIGKVGIDQTTEGTTNAVAPVDSGGTSITDTSHHAIKTLAQASESHMGEVGSNGLSVSQGLVTSSATVTTGKAIGPLQTLANMARVSAAVGSSGTGGYITDVVVTFLDAVGSGPADVYFFDANPSGSTCTNNTTFALVAADYNKVIGVAHITDFTASNPVAIGQAHNLTFGYDLASSTSAYACVVSRGSFAITNTANAAIKVVTARN